MNQDWIKKMNDDLERRRQEQKQYKEENPNWKLSAAAKAGGALGGKIGGGKRFKKMWDEDPNQFKESATKGGITQGNINKENGIGLFGQTKEEWSMNAVINAKSFWINSSEEKLKARNEKAGNSIKKSIQEKKQNGTWNPKKAVWTEEMKKEAIDKRSKTRLSQKETRIKELYDAIDTTEWFTIEYATEILLTISKNGASQSTTRRMIHGWKEASKYYEFRKTEVNEIGKKYMQWKKI